MDRRVVVVATAAAALVVLAAASDPVRVWTTPPSDTGAPAVETVGTLGTIAAPAIVGDESRGTFHWGGVLLEIAGVLIILAAVVVLVTLRPSVRPRWLRRLGEGRGGEVVVLPEVAEHELSVDVDAARAALATGEPRNAIVACWMHLERDAATAGLPRVESETSAEYAQRVVALSSVDPAPIGELAALYREARFSRHDMTDDHRSRAFAALDRVAAALRRGVRVAP